MALMFFFFFNDTATTEIYTLSLHDALPISQPIPTKPARFAQQGLMESDLIDYTPRSEEHTSELQSQSNLVCRLLLEKKKFSVQHWSAPPAISHALRSHHQHTQHTSAPTTRT